MVFISNMWDKVLVYFGFRETQPTFHWDEMPMGDLLRERTKRLTERMLFESRTFGNSFVEKKWSVYDQPRDVILEYTDEKTGIKMPYGLVPGDGRTLSRTEYPALYKALGSIGQFPEAPSWLDLGGIEFDFPAA